MIELCVEDYCQNCPDFRANVEQTDWTIFSDSVKYDTKIYCKNRDRCRVMAAYLSGKVEEK